MRTNLNNQFKTKEGITLISLVVTIIVLLILAGISIQMLTGDNGILKRASEASETTGISQVLEEVKLVATEGMSNYYLGEEENIVTAVENAISIKVSGFKEFTSTRGTSPIQGIVTRNGKDYAFSVDANSGVVTSPEESDYQWKIVADNDKNKEGREDREVFFCEDFPEAALIIGIELPHRQLRDVLQLAGYFFHVSRRKPAQQGQNNYNRPHGYHCSSDFQRADREQDIACFFHILTSLFSNLYYTPNLLF